MDSLIDRLNNAYKFLLGQGLVHRQQDLALVLGKTPSQISDAFNNRPKRLTLKFLTAIADAFPLFINKDYMLTGEGDVDARLFPEYQEKQYRPHITDTKVAAGFMAGIAENGNYEMRELNPNVRDYDFSIEVDGNSMLPEIQPGDIVYCRKVTNRYEDVEGKLCLIDSAEGGVIKIIASDKGESLTLHSFNPSYKDYQVSKADIYQIARVVGLTRSF